MIEETAKEILRGFLGQRRYAEFEKVEDEIIRTVPWQQYADYCNKMLDLVDEIDQLITVVKEDRDGN